MKWLLLIFSFITVYSCSNVKQISRAIKMLNGKWVPVKEEFSGVNLPPTTFQKQKLYLNDSTYKVEAESIDYGIVKYNGDKMDIYGKQGVNAGKHIMAIYKYENDFLTICYNLKGDQYPVDFGTKGKKNYFLVVYKKG